MNNQHN